jgi:putative addiction module killer protein
VIDLREYQSSDGQNPFREWFDSLSSEARQKVSTSLIRMGLGNFSNVKGVGSGVFEYRIDFGPGFRIYFGKDGDRIVILLAGGTKKRQQTDIELASLRWRDYKLRKPLK